ncbi:MAG: ubiquinone biosynthesis protein UbiH [Gallionellales bacterium CG03_land_8_20_14_0_80_55_15]|nr:MAG: ubiquinone biosynthesis protein UbiH [Gallionellales bacterium CG03_land_8_20_14_0_80_55_15]
MKTPNQYDVVIIGGGLVGASLAAALKNSGLALALVEAGSAPAIEDDSGSTENWDSRIYAISPGSRTFLEQSGAWQRLDPRRVAPVEEMRVFGDSDAELKFSAYQMGVPELACIVENRHLQAALWQGLQSQDNLDFIHPARCAALALGEDAARLTLEDGREFGAKLIVGADGRDSWVRNQAGISAAPVDYQHHGVVANFSCELPHRGIAHQWFAPDGILALLPLPGNRLSMVWSVTPEKSAELTSLTDEALCAQVAAASHHTLGKLQILTPAAAFPLRLLVLPHISAKRVALIGDAAHNMHPLAGQGVNTGFRDARQLAELLIDRGGCTDGGDAQLLRRYDRKRREDIYSMQSTTYGLKKLFCNDDPLLRTLRNLGLNATNHLIPLKKLLMQHALN